MAIFHCYVSSPEGTFKYYGLLNIAVCARCFTWSEPSNIRTGILDYLREGCPWPARPFKHTESHSFKHTATTFKYIEIFNI